MDIHSQLARQKEYLAGLLEAVQRGVFFLEASVTSISWPLEGEYLELRKKDTELFEALSAINERFSKLQDTLGMAMRQSLQLSGEPVDSFMKVLAFFEKKRVVPSVEAWQEARTARNLAAHSYEISYGEIAEHFNVLSEQRSSLYRIASGFVGYCDAELGVRPRSADFAAEFEQIAGGLPR